MSEPLLIEMNDFISSAERGEIVKALFDVGSGGSIEPKPEAKEPSILQAYAEQAAKKLGDSIGKSLVVTSQECVLIKPPDSGGIREKAPKATSRRYWLKLCLSSHCEGVWKDWSLTTAAGKEINMRPGVAVFYDEDVVFEREPFEQKWHIEWRVYFEEGKAVEAPPPVEKPHTFQWGLYQIPNFQTFHKRGVFSVSQCAEIVSACREQKGRASEQKPAEVGSGVVNDEVRVTDVQFLYSNVPENRWIFEALCGEVVAANESRFQFDLRSIQSLQYGTYQNGDKGFYGRHVDAGVPDNETLDHRKLSFSVQLSPPDAYEGGDLIVHFDSDPKPADRDQGAITFFPSYALHEVTPVTKGTRHSLVGWVTGPAFK
jgi:PKHD-type hydroxylase